MLLILQEIGSAIRQIIKVPAPRLTVPLDFLANKTTLNQDLSVKEALMRVSHHFVLAGAILAIAGCQGLNERVSYVNYDGYTGADFATAGADGAIDVVG